MSKRFDISCPRPKKDGGTIWVRIGTAWQNEKGIQLVFDALPLPDAKGRCVANLFEPREPQGDRQRSASNDAGGSAERSGAKGGWADDLGDDIAF